MIAYENNPVYINVNMKHCFNFILYRRELVLSTSKENVNKWKKWVENSGKMW